MALLQNAQARHAAIDLAEGRGLLGPDCVTRCDSGDTEEWEGALQSHPMDDRRRPVIWDHRSLLTVAPPYDGWGVLWPSRSFRVRATSLRQGSRLGGDAYQMDMPRASRRGPRFPPPWTTAPLAARPTPQRKSGLRRIRNAQHRADPPCRLNRTYSTGCWIRAVGTTSSVKLTLRQPHIPPDAMAPGSHSELPVVEWSRNGRRLSKLPDLTRPYGHQFCPVLLPCCHWGGGACTMDTRSCGKRHSFLT